jgi:hypothetical protein
MRFFWQKNKYKKDKSEIVGLMGHKGSLVGRSVVFNPPPGVVPDMERTCSELDITSDFNSKVFVVVKDWTKIPFHTEEPGERYITYITPKGTVLASRDVTKEGVPADIKGSYRTLILKRKGEDKTYMLNASCFTLQKD